MDKILITAKKKQLTVKSAEHLFIFFFSNHKRCKSRIIQNINFQRVEEISLLLLALKLQNYTGTRRELFFFSSQEYYLAETLHFRITICPVQV